MAAIERSIDSCDVVLAVIGRRWAAVDLSTGLRRLDDERDDMRLELEIAIRSGRRVVPVVVDHAQLPRRDELPESLRPLLEFNGVELRDDAWTRDLESLYAGIGVPRADAPTPDVRAPDRPIRRRIVVVAIIGLGLAALGAFVLPRGGGESSAWRLVVKTWARPQATPVAMSG